MAGKDEVLHEDDGDNGEELTIVELKPGEKPPEPKAVTQPAGDDDQKAEGDDEHEDEGDARLSAEEHDEDGDADTPARRKRIKRRQAQRAAREATFQRLNQLEQTNAILMRRLGMVEGATLHQSEQQIDLRLDDERQNIAKADRIIAKAIATGNGDDAAEAMRLRDEARERLFQLQQAKHAVATAREEAAQQQGPDPRGADPRQQIATNPDVVNHARDWARANPWYNPSGQDAESKLVNRIDREIAAEGFDPRTRAYWQELTKRVQEEMVEGDEDDRTTERRSSGNDQGADRRPKGPPMRAGRSERGGGLGKNEVYVTPEQKAALIEAGYWDDPKKRARMLKRYQQQNSQTAR